MHAAGARVAGDAGPLERESGRDHVPAVVLHAEQAVARHDHVVEEHLVELVGPGHRVDRPHGDAGRRHVDEQHADARVLAGVGGRCGRGAGTSRRARRRSSTRSSGRSRRSGRRSSRSAWSGATRGRSRRRARRTPGYQITSPRAIGGRKRSLLLRRAEAHDERPDVVEVHVLRATRLLVGPHLLAQTVCIHTLAPLPAVLGRPRHREPAAVGELAADLAGSTASRVRRRRTCPRHQSGSSSARNARSSARNASSSGVKAKSISGSRCRASGRRGRCRRRR